MPARDLTDIQLVRGSKRQRAYIRAAPYTIWFPTLRQIQMRIKFGRAAKKARERIEKFKNGLPIAAALVKEELKGVKSDIPRTRLKVWEERLLKAGYSYEFIYKVKKALVRMGLTTE